VSARAVVRRARRWGAPALAFALALAGCASEESSSRGAGGEPSGGSGSSGGGAGAASSSSGTTTETAGAGGGAPVSCDMAAPPSAGLVYWLRAGEGVTVEEGRVTAWADQAGGAPATPYDPAHAPLLVPDAIHGKPVVRFEDGLQGLSRDVPIDGLEELSLILVNATTTLWKDDPTEWCHHVGCDPNGPPGPRLTSETGCSGTYQKIFWWNGSEDWTGVYLTPKQEEVAFRFGNGSNTYSEEPCDALSDPLVSWARPASIGAEPTMTIAVHDHLVDRLYVGGEKVSETPAPGGQTPQVYALDRLDIGNGFGWIDEHNHGGDIAEVLVYAKALSDAEREAVELYLRCSFFPDEL